MVKHATGVNETDIFLTFVFKPHEEKDENQCSEFEAGSKGTYVQNIMGSKHNKTYRELSRKVIFH